MRKTILSMVTLSTMLIAPIASMAADMPPPPLAHGPMPGPMPAGPRAEWMKNAPVPMLMPIVWRHAIELKLTPQQESQLETWRKEQKGLWQAQMEAMRSHNRALQSALLRGATGSALQPLEDAVLADHQAMLKRGIAQVAFVHKLLNAEQWQKVTAIYAKMEKGPQRGGWHKP